MGVTSWASCIDYYFEPITFNNFFMIYYLIAAQNENIIFLVRNSQEKSFREQWGEYIVISSTHIIELLPSISLNSIGQYSSCVN